MCYLCKKGENDLKINNLGSLEDKYYQFGISKEKIHFCRIYGHS